MRLMSKSEYLIFTKGTKFTGSGKLGLKGKYSSIQFRVQNVILLVRNAVVCLKTGFENDNAFQTVFWGVHKNSNHHIF